MYEQEVTLLQDRIKEIRKANGMTQTEFGEKIGIKGNTVTGYETGIRSPSDAVIVSICREFGVNEAWLRTGDGEMFPPKSRGQEIGEIVKAASQHDPETAAKFFTSLLEEMSDAEIVLMYEIFKRHFPAGKQKEGQP